MYVAPVLDPAAEVAGPVDEGSAASFTVSGVDPEADWVYADWTHTGTFGLLDPSGWRENGDGSYTFDHVYDRGPNDTGTYEAVFRFEDAWGQRVEKPVTVVVNNVAPRGTIWAGTQIASEASSGQVVWALRPGENLEFRDVVVPSAADRQGIVYVWKINGGDPVKTVAPTLSLPEYRHGRIYTVEAWIVDRGGAGTTGSYQKFTVVVDDYANAGGFEPAGDFLMGGGLYGSVSFADQGVVDGYNRFGYEPLVARGKDDPRWGGQTGSYSFTATYQLDEATAKFAADHHYTVVYEFAVRVYDMEEFSLIGANHDLEAEYTQATGQNTLAWSGGDDKEVEVRARAV